MTRNSGFTLVEILIVVIILGILAAIVIPQFTDASNEARLSSLQSDLQTVRSQIELYKIQHLDNNPWADSVTQGTDIWTQMTTVTDATGAAGGNLGPYLQQPPTNPFSPAAVSTTVVAAAAAPADDAAGWWFNTTTGAFPAVNTTGRADLAGY